MRLTVLFPTQTEAQYFEHPAATTALCGVGLSSTAYHTLKTIQRDQPDILILAGIAGMYPHADLSLKQTVLVQSECEADLGFFTHEGFVHLSKLPIEMDFERRHTVYCPHIPANCPLPQVASYSMNAALAPFVHPYAVDIENMEGAAFFHVCQQEKQRFYEIRTISNEVKLGHDDWDMDGSVRQLAHDLHRFIDFLLATPNA